jgi:hypothetical protein
MLSTDMFCICLFITECQSRYDTEDDRIRLVKLWVGIRAFSFSARQDRAIRCKPVREECQERKSTAGWAMHDEVSRSKPHIIFLHLIGSRRHVSNPLPLAELRTASTHVRGGVCRGTFNNNTQALWVQLCHERKRLRLAKRKKTSTRGRG